MRACTDSTVQYTTTVISLQKLISLSPNTWLLLHRYLSLSHEHHIAPGSSSSNPLLYSPAPQTTLQYFPPPPPSLCNLEQYLSLSSRLVTASHTPTITKQKVRDLCIVCPGPRAGFRYILTAKVTIQERAPQTRISWARGTPGPIPRRALREVQFQAAYNTRVTDGLSTSSLTW